MVGRNLKSSDEVTALYELGEPITGHDWSWFDYRAFWFGKQLVVETVAFDQHGSLMYVAGG